jgi:hypothetical protein
MSSLAPMEMRAAHFAFISHIAQHAATLSCSRVDNENSCVQERLFHVVLTSPLERRISNQYAQGGCVANHIIGKSNIA